MVISDQTYSYTITYTAVYDDMQSHTIQYAIIYTSMYSNLLYIESYMDINDHILDLNNHTRS